MRFISCVKWVKQGVASQKPDKIELTSDEIENIICEENNEEKENGVDHSQTADEYDMEEYDNEDISIKASVKDVAIYNKYNDIDSSNWSDSEEEDEQVKPDDNLIVLGHVQEDMSWLEIHIYNDNSEDCYVHHDIILDTQPLCLETLSICKEGANYNNLCAVGGMKPVIQVWDLDIINSLQPAFTLGRCKKKNPSKNYGHTEAILDIAWNQQLEHILSSASVDESVILWDLDTGQVSTTITCFADKVQCLAWGQFDSSLLMTGSADTTVRNFDCRLYDQFQCWQLNSAVEKVMGSINDENICYAGTEQGFVYCIDKRVTDKHVWCFQAHEKEITGMCNSKTISNTLVTCSMDETIKVWDLNNQNKLIVRKHLELGELQCLHNNPDIDYLICAGGTSTKKKPKFQLINLKKMLDEKQNIQVPCDNNYNNVALLEDSNRKSSKTFYKNGEGIKKKKRKYDVPSNKSENKKMKDD